MNRQQKRASARSASKRDSADGMAAVAMAARVAALSPEGRAAAYETATARLSTMGLSPAERAGAEQRLAIVRALVDSIDEAIAALRAERDALRAIVEGRTTPSAVAP